MCPDPTPDEIAAAKELCREHADYLDNEYPSGLDANGPNASATAIRVLLAALEQAEREVDRWSHYAADKDAALDRAEQAEAKLAERNETIRAQDLHRVELEAKLAESEQRFHEIKAFLGDASPKSKQAYERMVAERDALRAGVSEEEP